MILISIYFFSKLLDIIYNLRSKKINILVSAILFLSILIPFKLKSEQKKIGLVLSGGFANGLVHVGVIKALEEHQIPIDYITGNSIGAMIGGLYSSGYTPKEIEDLFITGNIKEMLNGYLDDQPILTFDKEDLNTSNLILKLDIKNLKETVLPTFLTNPNPINYKLTELFFPASQQANYDFNNLLIPYRCIAADPIQNKIVILKNGSLSKAIRASIAFPFFLSPVKYSDDRVYIDGGIINNFPIDILEKEFNPDLIIGSSTGSKKIKKLKKESFLSIITALITKRSEKKIDSSKSVIIRFKGLKPGNVNFSDKNLIDKGYEKTIENIELIKSKLSFDYKKKFKDFQEKRIRHKQQLSENKIEIDSIFIKVKRERERKYYMGLLNKKKITWQNKKLKKNFITLYSDNSIKEIMPEININLSNEKKTATFDIEQENPFKIELGGIISSGRLNAGYTKIAYTYINRIKFRPETELFFSTLNTYFSAGLRTDFRLKIPLYLKFNFFSGSIDYYNSNASVFQIIKPKYILQNNNYLKGSIAFPINKTTKIAFSTYTGSRDNNYLPDKVVRFSDTIQNEFLNYNNLGLNINHNTLNYKTYASKGLKFNIKAKYTKGKLSDRLIDEPNQDVIKNRLTKNINWWQAKLQIENYIKFNTRFSLGLFGETMYSNQPLINNYFSTLIGAPAFYSTTESQTLFLNDFRSYKYLAIGIKPVFNIFKNLQVRLDIYSYHPYQVIIENQNNNFSLGNPWSDFTGIAQLSFVYHSPIGPLALNLNAYSKENIPTSILIHFGYFIFKKTTIYD